MRARAGGPGLSVAEDRAWRAPAWLPSAYASFVGATTARARLLEGLALLGPDDADGLSSDGVRPEDLGSAGIAAGLRAAVSELLG